MRALRLDQARRIALAAQGLARPRPAGRVDARHLRRVLRDVGLLQIDSVNVLERAHYLPVFSRLGPYPKDTLDDLAYRRRELFEYWAHEASLVPAADQPLYRHRMERVRDWIGARAERLVSEHPEYLERVVAEIAERGPISSSELSDPGDGRGSWWGWNDGKIACEYLFARGRLGVAGRRSFARLYDLTERVLPPAVLEAPTPDPDEAGRRLLLAAARYLGVGTAADLIDYHRQRPKTTRPLLAALAAEGLLEEVEVEGWGEPAYLHPEATLPRRVHARALLAPFDPLVWFRPRTERLFGFHYRIEIYVPAAKRRYGYYVLPFLLGDRLAARLDLKADRRDGLLRVQAAWLEPGEDPAEVAGELAAELRAMASWLGLRDVTLARRGNLFLALRPALT
jgi:uncharacterized protein